MVYKTAHFKLRDSLKIRVKKGTLLDRVKEIVSETNDAAVDLIKMVQDAIGGLPTNIEIGMDNTALTVEHVRGKKLAIYRFFLIFLIGRLLIFFHVYVLQFMHY